ncbi:MAG: hypothetical protein GY829_03215, partial [Gammaproteobacteria bacterium]|nr:hypothetical protein [Gammaproteobacteria bacterium]
MNIDDKRLILVIILLLTLVFIVGSYFIFTQEISNIESSISTKATERANKINEKMVLIRSFIKTMRNNLQQYIVLQEIAKTPHNAIDLIKYYPENDASTINEIRSAKKQLINGSFSADGKISLENSDRVYEISGAFYLDSTFQSALESISDLKWVYYLSKSNFAYTLPHIPDNIVLFDNNYYKKEYWTKAIPKNNPQERLVMTNVYNDSFGKGYLVTFSEPVYVDDEFRGIVGIDVSLDAFNLIMSMNMIIGDSFLLDENNNIIAASSEGEQSQILYIPQANLKHNNVFNAADGNDYISYEIVHDEVIFVHRLNRE